MQKTTIGILLFVCIASVMVSGCTSIKDMGTVIPPTTVHGTGPAIIKFHALNSSYTFHVVSKGDHAGMIITISGSEKNQGGEIQYHKIVNDPRAAAGVDVSKTLRDFTLEEYTIAIETVNDNAPWSIQIS
jgi:hypothetical protein